MSVQADYAVLGMTCAHCVASVTEEVQEIAGVIEVHVDLASGGLRVSSEHPIPASEVKGAVEEAGYHLV